MMVTGLPLFDKSSLLNGLSLQSASRDSETSQSLSFGEILKTKEKQLQQEQEANTSSAAVPLAAMQTLSMPVLTLGSSLVSDNESDKADLQPAVQSGSSPFVATQPSPDPLSLLARKDQAKTVLEMTPVDQQTSTPSSGSQATISAVGITDPALIETATVQALPLKFVYFTF